MRGLELWHTENCKGKLLGQHRRFDLLQTTFYTSRYKKAISLGELETESDSIVDYGTRWRLRKKYLLRTLLMHLKNFVFFSYF